MTWDPYAIRHTIEIIPQVTAVMEIVHPIVIAVIKIVVIVLLLAP
jgi:hypothetical protein